MEKLLAFEKEREVRREQERVKKEAERAAKQAAEEAARMQEEALRHPGKKAQVKRLVKKSSPLSYRASNCDGSGGNSYLYGKC